MTTLARTDRQEASHYYFPDGRPCYEVENKSKGGTRPTTLADAKKLGLLASVSTILRVIDKPALNAWKEEMSCLAVLTSPRNEGEQLDAFVHRILHEDRVQEEESQIARDKGTAIHDALQHLLEGGEVDALDTDLIPWVKPAYDYLCTRGTPIACERVLVGPGYAGRTDLIMMANTGGEVVYDFKTSKNIPKKPYSENALQLSAYAHARFLENGSCGYTIFTRNLYISTTECGVFKEFQNEGWRNTYENGFVPAMKLWSFLNGYVPPTNAV